VAEHTVWWAWKHVAQVQVQAYDDDVDEQCIVEGLVCMD